MTLTLELTSEQEKQLRSEAQRQGIDTRTYALALLTQRGAATEHADSEETSELPLPGSLTPSEIVAYWEKKGVLKPRPDLPDSPVYARQLREEAQNRVRE